MMLKEQLEVLIQENSILKRAVSTQHERQKEYEDRGQELQHLKQLVGQYQEQLRTLEVELSNLITLEQFVQPYVWMKVYTTLYFSFFSPKGKTICS